MYKNQLNKFTDVFVVAFVYSFPLFDNENNCRGKFFFDFLLQKNWIFVQFCLFLQTSRPQSKGFVLSLFLNYINHKQISKLIYEKKLTL